MCFCAQRDISGTKCDFSVQVQLRFCLSETSCPQEDHFPPNLCVKVNGKPCNLPVCNHRNERSDRIFIWWVLESNLIIFPHPGLPSSNQKRRRAQAAQPAHQHYLTGQIVHHSPQYHCGVVDRWDRKGKDQNVTVSKQGGLKRQRKLIQDGNKHVQLI